MNVYTVSQAFSEADVKSPDWWNIGKKLGLQLKDCINANIFFEGWQVKKSERSWEKLAQALEQTKGYEGAATKARQQTGTVISNQF